MFKTISPEAIAGMELIPQAIVARPTAHFSKRLNVTFAHEHDDLDDYEVAAFELLGYGPALQFALKHYAGYPADTTTIYLPFEVRDVEHVTHVIQLIAEDFGIQSGWIVWQRANDPTL